MAEFWLLAKIFYSMPNLESSEDPNGDALVLGVARPLIATCLERGWCRWGHYMRFSEQGYHLRLTLYGEEQVLEQLVMPLLEQTVQRHHAALPGPAQSPMRLSPLAQRLNHKWGGPKERFEVYPPGTALMGVARGIDDEGVFESPEAFAAHHRLHTDGARRAIALLEQTASHKQRTAFVRLLLDDFLRLTDLGPLERYCFLNYLKMQWISYFDLGPEVLEPFMHLHAERAERYQAYFARKRGPEDSLPLLPAALRPLYQDWIASLRELLPPVLGRDGRGLLTPYVSLRLLSFFHLTHNRTGVGLVQEVYLAHLLEQHYRSLLEPWQIAEAERWSRALQERSMPEEAAQR